MIYDKKKLACLYMEPLVMDTPFKFLQQPFFSFLTRSCSPCVLCSCVGGPWPLSVTSSSAPRVNEVMENHLHVINIYNNFFCRIQNKLQKLQTDECNKWWMWTITKYKRREIQRNWTRPTLCIFTIKVTQTKLFHLLKNKCLMLWH